MKVVILAGGLGSRISEESHLQPKPMIEVGDKPILWHVMKGYAHFGFTDFVICAGYKQHMIKEWFSDYFLHSSDVTFDYTGGSLVTEVHDTRVEPWRVTVTDTGFFTNTAGRILRTKRYIGDETFMLTYGDGVSDVDPNDILAAHNASGMTVTLTGVTMNQRFGVMDVDKNGRIRTFREKHPVDSAMINGGFMVCNPRVYDVIEQSCEDPDATDFSGVTLEWMASHGELGCYHHDGFWACMDTQRDHRMLEKMWREGNAPWKVW